MQATTKDQSLIHYQLNMNKTKQKYSINHTSAILNGMPNDSEILNIRRVYLDKR